MCVELICDRDRLEAFCATHAAVLHDKIIVYKHLEHWRFGAGRIEAGDLAPPS